MEIESLCSSKACLLGTTALPFTAGWAHSRDVGTLLPRVEAASKYLQDVLLLTTEAFWTNVVQNPSLSELLHNILENLHAVHRIEVAEREIALPPEAVAREHRALAPLYRRCFLVLLRLALYREQPPRKATAAELWQRVLVGNNDGILALPWLIAAARLFVGGNMHLSRPLISALVLGCPLYIRHLPQHFAGLNKTLEAVRSDVLERSNPSGTRDVSFVRTKR